MKIIFKELLWKILSFIGIHHLFRYFNKKKILILMYHGIDKRKLDLFCWWQLDFKKFTWQVKYIKKYYTILPLETLLLRIKENEPLPNNVAVITFDDGYENNFTITYPLLVKEKVPATIFLTTNFINTNIILWPDEIYLAFNNTHKTKLDLSDINLGTYCLKTKSSRARQ